MENDDLELASSKSSSFRCKHEQREFKRLNISNLNIVSGFASIANNDLELASSDDSRSQYKQKL